MELLTRAVESLTGNSIPYTFKEKIISSIADDPNRSKSIWNIFNGVSNKDSSPVSIFEFDLKNPLMSRYSQQAKNAFKKSRSLSLLPGVLTVVDSIQNDTNLYIITERIRPLEDALTLDYPEESFPDELITLGLYQIASALKFINVEGSSVHCNVCKEAIFVTMSGEWKLGGFELLVSLKERDFAILSTAYQLPTFHDTISPPEFQRGGADYFNTANSNLVVKFDTYKFGALAYQLLTRSAVSEQKDMSNMNGVPVNMAPHLKKCIHPSLTVRYSMEQFLKFGDKSFFNVPLVKLCGNLNELSLKNGDEKLEIFQSLDEIETLPRGMFEYRIMPDLISTFNILETNENNRQSILLFVILKNMEQLSADVFDRLVKPVIFQAFTYPDRAIRMTLLNALPDMVPKLSNYEVQDKIFPNLVKGFNDTNVAIREETVKSIIPIVLKISDRQLNNELLRYLARLQNDESPEIRTNVIVCLTKVAEHMNSNSRIGVLTTAFGKALKDPFVPARLNTVLAFRSSIDYFPPEVCCSKTLSALAPAMLDKSSKVRKEAQQAVEVYLAKILKAASELPDDDEETMKQEQEQTESLKNGMNSLSLNNVALSAKKTLFGFGNNSSSASLEMNDKEETTPEKVSTLNVSDDDLDFDDSWTFDDEEVGPAKPASPPARVARPAAKVTARPAAARPAAAPRPAAKQAPSIPATITHKATPTKKPKALKLKAKSKLNVELDFDEDGWGDQW
ncbi:DEKNAAC103009 [Brettanomyces naardenensis]|uniref:DEKNAAC103009 n=1 Tax=Brettanomyces naardenensis TaxID=13370 RepID=A0A448YM87_BRENA|nr:DEKNAAC103009 [Brettanomyces naardenensis]